MSITSWLMLVFGVGLLLGGLSTSLLVAFRHSRAKNSKDGEGN